MSEPQQPQTIDLDDPEKRWKVVRTLLILSPFLFVFCYLLAWVQGAETRHSVLIAVVGTAMCLVTAGVIHVMGSKSWMALVAVKIALMFVKRR